MFDMSVRNNTIQIGPHFSVEFQRTLRIPDDGGTYPLPTGFGGFPIYTGGGLCRASAGGLE